MLIRRAHLDGIRTGEITLAFRRWKRPTVRAGGTLQTAVGQLAIESVDVVSERAVTRAAASKAGYPSRAALLADLRSGDDRELYRIGLRLAGPDPRVALRGRAKLSTEEADEIRHRLDRFDQASHHGPWTAITLRLIRDSPATRAPDLAASAGWEKAWFKTNVRKLKALGLTESLEVGYRLSKRGEAFLKRKGRRR